MTTVAIDARFAVGERRGIGKGSLELLRSLVQLDAPLFYELLVDRGGNEALIDARENWRWRRLRPAPYPLWEQVALPRYVRGHVGTVAHVLGCHVFPDSNSLGLGESPHWLYTVRFDGRELWGLDGDPSVTVSVDAWEPYLEPA